MALAPTTSVPPHDVASSPETAPLPPEELERLSAQYARTRCPRLREELVHHHQRLVRSIAVRFLSGGESLDDLMQVGNIGLINALDRFNPDQGNRFSTYATPTILGEIKRHFRDKTAAIKMPRWLQELQQGVRRTSVELAQSLGRSPTTAELARALEVSEEQIVEALESGEALNPMSLDSRLDPNGVPESSTLQDLIGRQDPTLCEIEDFSDLRYALNALSAREREVIALRFFDDLSQAKIAERLDISQMHVSRLQQRALRRLRELLSVDNDAIP